MPLVLYWVHDKISLYIMKVIVYREHLQSLLVLSIFNKSEFSYIKMYNLSLKFNEKQKNITLSEHFQNPTTTKNIFVEIGKICTLPKHFNTRPLTFLAWYRHFNKKWQG